jgi:[acyl-carrier-protein] S-malonyltransferase
VTDPDEISRLLVEQVTGRVRWRESVLWMAGAGVSASWSSAPAGALAGMVRRVAPQIAEGAVGGGTPGAGEIETEGAL